MTESPRPENEAADEAVSAVLDGEATLEQADRVAGSADLSARLEVLRTLAGLVGAEVATPVDELDRIRAQIVSDAAGSGRDADAIDLADAAERRRGRMPGFGRAASMAAALLAAGGLGYGIAGLDSDGGYQDSALDAPADDVEATDDRTDSATMEQAASTDEAADGDESAGLSPDAADLSAGETETETLAQSPCEAQLTDEALAAGAAEVDAARLHITGISVVVITGRRHDQQTVGVWMAPEPACEPVSAFSLDLG